VDERYWRPTLEGAQAMLWEVRKAAGEFQRRAERTNYDPADIKSAVLEALGHSPLGASLLASLKKIPDEMVETLIGFGIEIVQGKFSGFSADTDEEADNATKNARRGKKELSKELNGVITVLGANVGERHAIDGQTLNFSGVIEKQLQEISKGIGKIHRDRPIIEPSIEARREFVQAVEMGTTLYRAASEIFGRSALGLGVFNRIATNPAIAIQATMLLGWIELRKISKELLLPSEIASLSAKLDEIIGTLTTK
jgi:hypothetical protein